MSTQFVETVCGWIRKTDYKKAKGLDPKARILCSARTSLKMAFTAENYPQVEELVIGKG